jgi:hypothetical protein
LKSKKDLTIAQEDYLNNWTSQLGAVTEDDKDDDLKFALLMKEQMWESTYTKPT